MSSPDSRHDGHLVPGLVHFASVDAFDGEHVEDDLLPVNRHLLRRECRASQSSPRGSYWPAFGGMLLAFPDISRTHIKAFFHAQMLLHFAQVCLGRIDRKRYSDFFRQPSAGFGLRRSRQHDGLPRGEQRPPPIRPMGPAPVISTSSPKTGNDRAVWTAFPKGSKICGQFRGPRSGCAARCCSWEARCTPQTRRRDGRRRRAFERKDAGGRPSSCDMCRRQRGPLRSRCLPAQNRSRLNLRQQSRRQTHGRRRVERETVVCAHASQS